MRIETTTVSLVEIQNDSVVRCQWAFGAKMTSYRRRCDVITSHRRQYDVIFKPCARWDGPVCSLFISILSQNIEHYECLIANCEYEIRANSILENI